MSPSIESGLDVGAKRFTGTPSRLMRNLPKFQAMSLMGGKPGLVLSFSQVNRGCAPAPLTSTLDMMGNFAPFRSANLSTSASEPGSCPPNWLQGKARISRPSLRYFEYSEESSL